MIIALIFCTLVCAVAGTYLNYIGVELMRYAFDFAGGEAIGVFFGGLFITTNSLATFILFAICVKLLIEQIKYILKGGK